MMQVERWTLLIVRASLVSGVTKFGDFQSELGIDPNLLAARLDDLVSGGVFTVTTDPAQPRNSEYRLTAKGVDLEASIEAISEWSERWNEHDPLVGSTWTRPASVYSSEIVPARVVQAILSPRGTDSDTRAGVVIEIAVLGTFALRVGGTAIGPLSIGSQRLLVFLALHDRAVARAAMAGAMWPEVSDEKAGISLRSALSRLDTPTREAILVASAGLRLAETVFVDLRAGQALARRILQPSGSVRQADLGADALAILSSELLPDWYDDWVIAEAEDWRQLRMNALEALATVLTESGRLADAAGAARAAMKVEPLRESAHATLIRVHLAEGNQSEAIRVYERYRTLLSSALGLEPTARLSELVSALRTR